MATSLDTAFDFAGKVVLVTGGTKGVGRGITERFLEAGAHVVVTARNQPDTPVSTGDREAVFVAADVRDPDRIAEALAATTDRFGRLDVLVNNAGGSPHADVADVSPRFLQAIVNLNMMGPLYFAQQANAIMQGQDGGGSIVNIGSVAGSRPSPGSAAYGAAKAGLLSLTRSLAMEWAPKVRVNMVTGGYILTEQASLHYGDETGVQRVAATVPMGRLADPTDIADACLFLASPLARHITGTDLDVHGGGERPPFLAAAAGT
ncbi:MAG: SDR family oxidoreductase [Acidimicrobiales bacterium]|jgi:NAD(P)-dependent dehydrogenase (short-subunit alcohol dehydrogenase family)|nr:SDR family oxidoreductase [Acidimicrobiales bacterium]